MNFKYIICVSICTLQISLGQHVDVPQRALDYVAYQSVDNPEVVFLKISPSGWVDTKIPVGRQQEDEDDDEPSTTPYIPAIIPGVTKIFNGLLTGNLNEIFHGSTSFAPKQTAHEINTVYNQVVGLPPPKTRGTSTVAPLGANSTVNGTAPVGSTATPDDDDEDSETENEEIRAGLLF